LSVVLFFTNILLSCYITFELFIHLRLIGREDDLPF